MKANTCWYCLLSTYFFFNSCQDWISIKICTGWVEFTIEIWVPYLYQCQNSYIKWHTADSALSPNPFFFFFFFFLLDSLTWKGNSAMGPFFRASRTNTYRTNTGEIHTIHIHDKQTYKLTTYDIYMYNTGWRYIYKQVRWIAEWLRHFSLRRKYKQYIHIHENLTYKLTTFDI